MYAISIYHASYTKLRNHPMSHLRARRPSCGARFYDAGYPGEALPLVHVEFRQAGGSPGIVLDRVIPECPSGQQHS